MIQIITERDFGGGFIHKDGDNRILGCSKANPFAPKEYFHYDPHNNLLGHSSPDFGGGYLHYDAGRNYIGKSVKNPFGGYVHYDTDGYNAGRSEPSFDGGLVHHNITLVIFR